MYYWVKYSISLICFTLYCRFTLTGIVRLSIIRVHFVGGIAQLGERLHGMQEVSGSIPLTSTSFRQYRKLIAICLKSFSPHRLVA